MNEVTLSKKNKYLCECFVGFALFDDDCDFIAGGYQVLIDNCKLEHWWLYFQFQELALPANLIADSISNLQSVKGIMMS